MGSLLHDQPVMCAQDELAIFNPPPGQSCGEYAANFLQTAVGYLSNPGATESCGYCQYTTGDNYLASINISYDFRWQSFGIFLGFVISNYALVYLMVYSRVRGWHFGFGYLVKGLKFLTRQRA